MAFPQPSSFDGRATTYMAPSNSQVLAHRPSRSDVGHQSFNGDAYPLNGNGQIPRPPALSPQMSVASFDSQSVDEVRGVCSGRAGDRVIQYPCSFDVFVVVAPSAPARCASMSIEFVSD